MENLTFVTGNYGKYLSVKKSFEKENIQIKYFKFDLEEPDVNDIEFISKVKAKEAYELLNRPVFVLDMGFYIEDYPDKPGYPGAFVKRTGISSNIDNLLEVMEKVKNRECYFLECLTFYDGNEFYKFFGVSRGTLSYEKRGINQENALSNLWYVFIPNNCTKTLAEMTEGERKNRDDGRKEGVLEFINWYKKNYLKEKIYNKGGV